MKVLGARQIPIECYPQWKFHRRTGSRTSTILVFHRRDYASYSILGLDVAALKDDEMFPEKSRDHNTKYHSQRCHRTPQLVSIPDAGPQKSRGWRNRGPGQYLGSCHRVSHTISASVHLRHPIPHSPALPR